MPDVVWVVILVFTYRDYSHMLGIPEVIIGMYHEYTEGVWGWKGMKSFRLAGIIFLKRVVYL